jgi:hypothetical protein
VAGTVWAARGKAARAQKNRRNVVWRGMFVMLSALKIDGGRVVRVED